MKTLHIILYRHQIVESMLTIGDISFKNANSPNIFLSFKLIFNSKLQ